MPLLWSSMFQKIVVKLGVRNLKEELKFDGISSKSAITERRVNVRQ